MYQNTILIGNVGKGGAELRYTPSGVPVASFSLAVSKQWTKDGQKQEKTTWFRISCWNKLAETVGQYVVQGMKIMVSGELDDPRTWTDKDGNHRASLEVTGREVKFLSRGEGGDTAQVVETEDAEPIPF
jgi:single-strand DNA-binding protein